MDGVRRVAVIAKVGYISTHLAARELTRLTRRIMRCTQAGNQSIRQPGQGGKSPLIIHPSLIIAIDVCIMRVHQSLEIIFLSHRHHHNHHDNHHFLPLLPLPFLLLLLLLLPLLVVEEHENEMGADGWKGEAYAWAVNVAKCHVMSCPRHSVLSCYIRHLMRCHAMQCHAMSCCGRASERTTRGWILILGYKRRTCKVKRQFCACLRACVSACLRCAWPSTLLPSLPQLGPK